MDVLLHIINVSCKFNAVREYLLKFYCIKSKNNTNINKKIKQVKGKTVPGINFPTISPTA
ncbi:hypothetical protein A2303_01480 [Candidatus Falkowbacteria bacterium RIFOXYB2_FULL_47_14]|uniref:Uncharacterized protein n=1 Tax=Candidatus Falkowbacteria bacterium RIFOXYA2_FULL_47_19 TaxID=1797994 RepID=A0A1F5SLV7_9BACT|nr:MAG: hypothetical protein A2227_01555 [Candidatus Falkowbacteria bacterium RIFOXYA2_FULL_47_19]OGF34766.1 MAG: hypothetical protein A2468_03445 [Candidatus Falkowbacteria bacterium RIFOXYC2_FULL_46_15]OGF43456.1 MAG: hypothetical protein A2303_01480 [Candidatus Falkowbacteria bacterium RIFOXYB2_FULL_47_14]